MRKKRKRERNVSPRRRRSNARFPISAQPLAAERPWACHPERAGLPSLGWLPSRGGDLRGWHIPRISVYSSADKHIHAVPSIYPTPLFVLLGIRPFTPVSHSLPLPIPASSFFSHSHCLSLLSLLSLFLRFRRTPFLPSLPRGASAFLLPPPRS